MIFTNSWSFTLNSKLKTKSVPLVGLELGTCPSVGAYINRYTIEFSRKPRCWNTIYKFRIINYNSVSMNLQIWRENYDDSSKIKSVIIKSVLCWHYSDNISCNNFWASQHWVMLTCSRPIERLVRTPPYNKLELYNERCTKL